MVQKIAMRCEFEAWLRHATTEKLSLLTSIFLIREGQGIERRGMGFAFHQLCPTAPTVIGLWETFTFLNSDMCVNFTLCMHFHD